jgi:hypothetical protein
VRPASKLDTRAWWPDTTLGVDLGIADASTDEIYAAMDWLVDGQGAIETKLAAKHLGGQANPSKMALFDLSSTWMTGNHCELAARGYSRDGKKACRRSISGCLGRRTSGHAVEESKVLAWRTWRCRCSRRSTGPSADRLRSSAATRLTTDMMSGHRRAPVHHPSERRRGRARHTDCLTSRAFALAQRKGPRIPGYGNANLIGTDRVEVVSVNLAYAQVATAN